MLCYFFFTLLSVVKQILKVKNNKYCYDTLHPVDILQRGLNMLCHNTKNPQQQNKPKITHLKIMNKCKIKCLNE